MFFFLFVVVHPPVISLYKQTDMSVNSSSSSSLNILQRNCFNITSSVSAQAAYTVTYYILHLPLIFLVLYIGYERWRKQRSVTTAALTSHSDIFTFNMVVVELIGMLGCCATCVGVITNEPIVIEVGSHVFSITPPAQSLFHLLTCVDRYLAVVHPIAYLRLRQRGGARIRNISIVCVWLLSVGICGFPTFTKYFIVINSFFLLGFASIVVLFCSLSVLCVLIRPGPGELGGGRERVDQSKLRAFHIIIAIMGALLLRFLSMLVTHVMFYLAVLSEHDLCIFLMCICWFSLPSCLVLPLLFLQRAGKLPGCKHNTESG